MPPPLLCKFPRLSPNAAKFFERMCAIIVESGGRSRRNVDRRKHARRTGAAMTEKFSAKYSYGTALVYLALFCGMFLMNFTMSGFEPFSLALLLGALVCGMHPLLAAGLYILAGGISLLSGSFPFLVFAVQGVLLGGTFFVYRRLRKKPGAETMLFLLAALAPYILLFGAYVYPGYIRAAIVAAALLALCLLFIGAMRCLLFRAGRCALSAEEPVFCAAAGAAVGIGLYNCAGGYAYDAAAVLLILFTARLCKKGNGVFFAFAASLPPVIVQSAAANAFVPEAAACYVLYAAVAAVLLRGGKIPAALGVFLSAVILRYFTDFFGTEPAAATFTGARFYLTMLVPLVPCLLFALTPESWLRALERRLHLYEEKPLTRASINRSRRRTGEKLFEISAAFREIEGVFSEERRRDDGAQALFAQTMREEVCESCPKRAECGEEARSALEKLAGVGLAKGKANLIDLPGALTAHCADPTALLFSLNRMLADYRRGAAEEESAARSRLLLAQQAHGVSELLKNLALGLSAPVGVEAETEQAVAAALGRAGFMCEEVLISGEGPEIYIVLSGAADGEKLRSAVESAAGQPLALASKQPLTAERCACLFRPRPAFDAAFGVASATKAGESACGDTYSLTRIDERTFLCALSDGMGSGEEARRVSDSALTLIESFCRAGMPNDAALAAVNGLLAAGREETFACVDAATVDLNTGRADIVKIGSPFSFLVTGERVEVLESESLPLGILEGVRPVTLTRMLRGGDVLVFVSDGVSEAFGSGTDAAAELSALPAANPQTLADALLARALARTGAPADDMTVVVVRLCGNLQNEP